MATSEYSWQNIFAGGEAGGRIVAISMRVVSRKGCPFLILPDDAALAAQTLELYAPQTFRARAAFSALKSALRWKFFFKLRCVSMQMDLDDPFVHFLQNLAHGKQDDFPLFGILSGNPSAPGHRFIILVFGESRRPVAVVKAGLSPEAKELIEREAVFLGSVPRGTQGLPALLGRFEQSRLLGLATGFVPGESPRTSNESVIPGLLTSWIHPHHSLAIGLTRTWWELKTSCFDHPAFAQIEKRLTNRIVHPTIFHGDFAPWNIKASDERWTVLDWERGQLNGLPGYDWLHYIVQTRILVEKKSTTKLVQELSNLLGSPAFQQYAIRSGISGVERELAIAYLLHHNEVIRPGQGRAQGRKILERLLQERWLNS